MRVTHRPLSMRAFSFEFWATRKIPNLGKYLIQLAGELCAYRAVLRCVREYCGDVEPAALATLTTLPEHYAMQNLDVRGTDQAHANGQSKPLVSQALEDSEAGDQPRRNSQPALS